MPAYLITGATGLVGSHLCCALLARGESVIAVKRNSGSVLWFDRIARFSWNLDERHFETLRWVEADFTENGSLDPYLHDLKAVIHCGGMVSFRKSERKELYRVNVNGTVNVARSMLRISPETPLCHVSSNSVFNTVNTSTVTEDSFGDPPNWGSYYGFTKYLAEQELEQARNSGLKVAILNPSVILGFSDPARSSGRLVKTLYRGVPICPPGTISVVGVGEVCRAISFLLEGELFQGRFLCVSATLTYKELYGEAARVRGGGTLPVQIPTSLLKMCASVLDGFSALKIPTPIEPEILRSAAQKIKFLSSRLTELSFEFDPIGDTLSECLSAYRQFDLIEKSGSLDRIGLNK